MSLKRTSDGVRGLRLGVAHYSLLLRYLVELGETADRCLTLTGLQADQIDDPDTEISADQEIALIRLLIQRHGAPFEHGIQVGLRQGLTVYGPWGMGVMSSPNVAEAAEWAGRFASLAFPFVRYQWQQGPDGPLIKLDYQHMPNDVSDFLVARDIAAIWAIHQDLVPDLPPGIREIRLPQRVVSGAEQLSQLFSCPVMLGQPCVALSVDPIAMRESLSRANRLTVNQCERLCRDLLDRRQSDPPLSDQVRHVLRQKDKALPTIAEVSLRLHRSERNLRRQLHQEGTGWRQLRDEILAHRARRLLDSGRYSVEQVADRLGYTDRSSFYHAFKRWTGTSPVRYRKR